MSHIVLRKGSKTASTKTVSGERAWVVFGIGRRAVLLVESVNKQQRGIREEVTSHRASRLW